MEPPRLPKVRYAVLQQSLEMPPVEGLRVAFRSVRGLTPADAHGLANDAFGILVKNLDAEQAAQLQNALQAQGIGSEIVAETALPKLPATKFVRRLDLGTDTLVIYDAIGRPVPVEWRHLALVAVGRVVTTEFVRQETVTPLPGAMLPHRRSGLFRGGAPEETLTPREVRTRERLAERWTLEIVLNRAVARFSVQVEEAAPQLFLCLGEERTQDLTDNLTRFVRRLVAKAPQAMPNRGAYFLRQEPATVFSYPSKNAFYEEITWLLWKSLQASLG
jgi:hypothetical protein